VYSDIDVVTAASNYGQLYGNGQGFLFMYDADIFWRLIVRWTSGLGGNYDASGWWMGANGQMTNNLWSTPSTVSATKSNYAMSVSWQNMVVPADETVYANFMVGSGYRGASCPPVASSSPFPDTSEGTTLVHAPMARLTIDSRRPYARVRRILSASVFTLMFFAFV
jgi:hypothetical protein